jgi:putative oxidoreductase
MQGAVQIAVFLLRVVSGLLLFQAGALKLFGWFGGMPPGVELSTLLVVAGVLEVFGGAAIILGILTRTTAFVLSGEMAFAYFIGHFPQGFWPIQNHGEPAVLLCFIFLFFAAYGAGERSLDALVRRKREKGPNLA